MDKKLLIILAVILAVIAAAVAWVSKDRPVPDLHR